MQSSARTVKITGQSLSGLTETPLFVAFQKTLCSTWETSSKDNISISASQHVLLLSLCGKQGALIIIKSMLTIYKSSFQGSTCQSSSHGGRGRKTVDFRLKAEDSCIPGCNDGFLGFWGLLEHFRRVTVLYFVPGNTERGFTPHIELPQRQKSWGENNFLEFGPNVVSIASSLHWEQLHNPNRKVMPMAVYPSFAVQLGNCMVFYILYAKKILWKDPSDLLISHLILHFLFTQTPFSTGSFRYTRKTLKCNVHINKGKLCSFFPSFLPFS